MDEAKKIAKEITRKGAGKTAGIIACCLAILGILTLGFVFVPLAIMVAFFGTLIALYNRNFAGVGICVLAWILIYVGVMTSPVLLIAISDAMQQL